jgi:hypothetical protein
MILHPSILALLVGSAAVGFITLYAVPVAAQILRRWDVRSGSEAQIVLERKTYLVSTLLAYVFAFEFFSLFLFVFTAERIHTFFVGAMCAAGSLQVNPYGYPALLAKLATFLFAGLWLILNHVDNRGHDYPLIRTKYAFFLGLVPLVLAGTVLQTAYFLQLKPNLITSCCGTLFSKETSLLPAGLFFTPRGPTMVAFFAVLAAAVGAGIRFARKGKGGYPFAVLSALALAVSLISIISFISPYIYELPTHHCPFCILQREYGFIGYPLYLSLFGGAILGLGVGILMPFKNVGSLAKILPRVQRRLALASAVLFLIFLALATARILLSHLVL